MKAYTLTTGIIFALIVAAHIARFISEWPPRADGEFVSMIALTGLAMALAIWGFVLAFRRRPNG